MKKYQVGGSVRDQLMNKTPKDYDFVVVGSSIEEMLSLGYVQVGKDFPVFLHPVTKHEYALARQERATGKGHKDFEFKFDSSVTLEDDLIRRDFTINAIARDLETGKLIDPFNGLSDIQNKILRHINDDGFREDPLRVLRLCRFAAQLGFSISVNTLQLCKDMVKEGCLDHLTPERIWGEFEKALHTDNFEAFINTLNYTGALKVVLPSVYKLIGVPQAKEYHPEGDCYTHTVLCVRMADKMKLNSVSKFAVLVHDVGKGLTPPEVLPKHIDHENVGLDVIEQLCKQMKVPNEYKKFALIACENHMRYRKVLDMNTKKVYDFVSKLTKNFTDETYLVMLNDVSFCDNNGRGLVDTKTDTHDCFKLCYDVYKYAKEVKVEDFPEHEKFKGKDFGMKYREKRLSYVKHRLKNG